MLDLQDTKNINIFAKVTLVITTHGRAKAGTRHTDLPSSIRRIIFLRQGDRPTVGRSATRSLLDVDRVVPGFTEIGTQSSLEVDTLPLTAKVKMGSLTIADVKDSFSSLTF